MRRHVTIVLKDSRPNEPAYVLKLDTSLPKERILPAIIEASKDYLNTSEGREIWESKGRSFTYEDFCKYVSNTYCIPRGIIVTSYAIADFEQNLNMELAAPSEE